MFPEAEEVIANRIKSRRFSRQKGRPNRWPYSSSHWDLNVFFDFSDIANLADVAEVPLWECEMLLTDDGF